MSATSSLCVGQRPFISPRRRFLAATAALLVSCLPLSPALAAVTPGGDTKDDGSNFYAGFNANGVGQISIDAGSTYSRSYGYLGYANGSSGSVTVTDSGSTWTNTSNLYVGYNGTGTLTVSSGGQVSNTYGYLGNHTGSSGSATVTGSGSTWTTSGTLYVGYSGTGTLTVADGGQVTAKTLYASLANLQGNGTITVQSGAILDTNLVFDASHGPSQAIASFGSGGQLQLTVDGTSELGVGYKQTGSLRIADGQSISTTSGTLGYKTGSTGSATVTGSGSKWTNTGALTVGLYGTCALTVSNGGQVSNSYGYLGNHTGSSGSATVTGSGSTWTNTSDLYVGYYRGTGMLTVSDGGLVTAKTLYASLANLQGNGTITVQSGAVLDADLVFDASHGATQTLTFGSGGQLQLTVDGTSNLGVGYQQTGTLRIANGRSINSSNGSLGYDNPGATGTATVTGSGSTWTNSGNLYLGTGTLTVSNGGQVSNTSGYLGAYSSTTGLVTVTGSGSKWMNTSYLYVGYSGGTGTLTVSNGGQVSATQLTINNSQSLVRLHINGNNMVVLGNSSSTGSVTNSGKISLLADAFLSAGAYQPITEYASRPLSWSGSGTTVNAGGTWSQSANTFTVTPATTANADTPTGIASLQRLLITDPHTQEQMGLSFGTLTTTHSLSAHALTADERSALVLLLSSQESLLTGWDFSGILAGGESLVSFQAGPNEQDLHVWRLNQGVWSPYTPAMLTYDVNNHATFTVDPGQLDSSGFAISGMPVPEPGSLLMLGLGGGVLLRRRR